MLRRLGTAALLLILVVPAIFFGGIYYFVVWTGILLIAAWEYTHIFTSAQLRPSLWIVLAGTLLLLAVREFRPAWMDWVFTSLILISMTYHMFEYERGRHEAALDFVLTLGGITYFGWIGGYFMDLRALPQGGWWVMIVFPVVWLADSGAYMIGSRYGKHKMLKRLSPKKSWEGFFAGVLVGTVYGGFFAFAYTQFGPLNITFWQGAALGLVVSSLSTLGDLGESMLKRFADIKDSGTFLPGHGGALDRIDSLIWAAVIGVIWIRLFLL
ncbi:MAG TPA: phosphatidate cytidylyltransferase [Anaerolineales bacterium]|nr:phosphatidate cytidylyltransferase [Anaerolineales bacterium]